MLEKIKHNFVCRRILVFLMKIMSVSNRIIPKNDRKILFYDSGREYLEDNTEALYTYLLDHGYDQYYEMICCVPREKNKGHFSAYVPVGTVRGIWAFLTCKYVFFSFGDFRIRPSARQMVINQWHGTPLKKIGKLSYDQNYQQERLDNFTYILAASNTFVPIMAGAFGCSQSKVAVIGNARNDYLFSGKKVLPLIGIKKENYDKLILWMPTFRKSRDNRFSDGNVSDSETMLPLLDQYEDLERLDIYLHEKNVLLVIKIHPMAFFRENNYRNILTITNNDLIPKGIKLYEFIKEFHVLLTDYSSVYCDYMLLDRPMGFTMDDYAQYERSRGFTLEHLEQYLPGHHIGTKDELYSFFDDVIDGKDIYKEMRRKVMPVFNNNTDGNNCERLIRLAGLQKK